MIKFARDMVSYRELLLELSLKNILVRYKQAYLGLAWAVLKPLMLMLMFVLVRSFVGIESGNIPYPILTFAALMPWTFFQDATSDSVNSLVANAVLIRKIYFPREIFPLAAVLTKIIELGINLLILAGLMIYYGITPTVYILWVPPIIFYTMLVALCVGMAGAAINVYFRDISSALPVLISLLMYASPVIYPLSVVQKNLLVNRAAGEWSNILYTVYTLNPLADIIDAYQRVLLYGQQIDLTTLLPGLLLTAITFPVSYFFFKRAEAYFADVI